MRDWITGETETISKSAPLEFNPVEKINRLQNEIESVIKGKSETVKLALVALLAKGHLLIEDVPGIGKTTLANALARALDLSFHRVQFTSDLLPSDVIGLSIYNQRSGHFEWNAGPIFSNVVLADEINRATPKTQSALLEAMAEEQITVEVRRARCRYRLWSSPRRIRPSITELIRCPNRSSIGLCCACTSVIRARRTSAKFCATASAKIR
jgi:MoxR-like ATPase